MRISQDMQTNSTALRNTAEEMINHRGGSVGSVVGNHRGPGGNSVVVTTLATFVRSDGIFDDEFIANLPKSLPVKVS